MMRFIWYVFLCIVVAYLFQTVALAAGLSWNLATVIGAAVGLFLVALYFVGGGRRGNDEVTK